ncbi:hypothetical protein E4634_13565 [Mangrovimicrobium sediminis]|uniref:DUF4189 domain-containing protein n=1 Tax=Mangrovimicrobium sediminis TaxID=2562682 RepID=A0A4Z0LZ53_9GAMM|nr:hypothetical protein [Haliea sp. SAOS-164]TGD72551.1 hypothetical protein E4634_13565 [Haliea sp. SAOS-164]
MKHIITGLCLGGAIAFGNAAAAAADSQPLPSRGAMTASNGLASCERDYRNSVLRARRIGYQSGNCAAKTQGGSPVYTLASYAGTELDANGATGDGECRREYRNAVLRARGIGQWRCDA